MSMAGNREGQVGSPVDEVNLFHAVEVTAHERCSAVRGENDPIA
jgi:hypothetical protein